MSDNKLFDDSQTFQKNRPTKPTAIQLEVFYVQMANEIIKENFSTDSIENIIADISDLYPFLDNGYEMAKKLEGYNSNASYEFDTSFCEWLDGLYYEYYKVNKQNIIDWATAHNIQPKYQIGSKLIVNENINSKVTKGGIFFITGSRPEEAVYWLNEDPYKNGGFEVAYEIVENKCTVINP